MGARPLRRVIQSRVEDVLSDGILAGRFSNGQTVRIEASGEDEVNLVVESGEPGPEPAKEVAAPAT